MRGSPYGLPAQAASVLGQFWTPIAGQYSKPFDSNEERPHCSIGNKCPIELLNWPAVAQPP